MLLSIGAASNETDFHCCSGGEQDFGRGNAEATDRSINKTVGLKDQ